MIESKNIEKYLLIISIIFITYLLLGSFVVGSNYSDLCYLILLYSIVIFIKIKDKKK